MPGRGEAIGTGGSAPARRDLAERAPRQAVLVEFGRRTLETSTLDQLLNLAARLCAEGLKVRFGAALEFVGEGDVLRLRAGVGWRRGQVGRASVRLDTPSGAAFRTRRPSVVDDAEDDDLFRADPRLAEHGVRRVLSVPVPLAAGGCWGALEAAAADVGDGWDDADVAFMSSLAGMLGLAIEQRRAQQALADNRAWLNVLLDSVDQVVWLARPDGHHDYFNRRWYETFAPVAVGESDGDDWAEWLHPDDRDRTFAAWRHSLETGEPYEVEYRFLNRAGEYRWLLGRAHAVRDASGRITRWVGTCTDIQAQKDFAERFRLLHQAHPSAYLVLTADFTVEEASESWLKATLQQREAIVGHNLFEAMPDNPDDPAATGVRMLRASLERVLAGRVADRMPVQRYDVRRPDGTFEVRWWTPLNSPVLGPDGEVRHIIHEVEDVTAEMLERQRAAEALAGEARFRAMAETLPGLVFETSPAGGVSYANPSLLDYAGAPLEALRDDLKAIVHPEDRERVAAAQREARTTAVFEVECRLRRADGAWRWFLVRASPFRAPDGQVEKWIGVASDVDAAKQAEAALRAREEQFRTLADSLPQLAWMADAKGWIYWYNRRWFEYTGATLEAMQGWGWRAVQHPAHVERVVERIQHAWDTGEPWEDLFPLRGADGRYRWFLSRAAPIRDAEGQVIRWFGTNTDVTEQQEAAELQRTLLREVSHRVKNSLALVSSLLTLQSRTLEGGSRGALEDAAQRVHAIARVHDQLWRAADARRVDLQPFLCELTATIATSAPQHETVCQADAAWVSADLAAPIGLLVNELLTNAYKYAYPAGAAGKVRVTGAREPDGRYRLEIADCGAGLPPDFDLAKPRDSLGMKVITSLSTQLGGELSAGSANPGARFSLVFPLETGTARDTAPRAPDGGASR